MKNQSNSKEAYVAFAGINASLGIVINQYAACIFNSIQEMLQEHLFKEASTAAISFIASSPFIGGLFGAIFTESLGKQFGRRATMILVNCVSLFGVGLTMLGTIESLVIGRMITGFYVGVASTLCDIYITEITEEPLRGQLGAFTGVSSALGAILALGLGIFTPTFIDLGITDVGLRLFLAVPGILNLLQMVNLFLFFKFETPFYLVYTKKEDEALEVLQLLYDEEYSAKLKELTLERDLILEKQKVSFKDLCDRKYRKSLLVSIIISCAPSFTGQNFILVFSNMIFGEGLDPDSDQPIILTNLFGLLSLLASIVGVVIIKRIGRRTLSLTGCSLLLMINLSVTLICYLDSIGNMGAKLLLVAWITIYASSLGLINFLYPAETLPEIGVGVITALSAVSGFISTQAFLSLIDSIGYGNIFLICSIILSIAILILYYFMIETKDKSKLEILKLYEEEPNPKLA